MTVAPEAAPDKPTFLDLTFQQGVPVALNGNPMPLAAMIKQLNQIAGANGIGRIDKIENRLVGIKSREVYEAPAAAVLMTAHHDLENLTLERDVQHFKPTIENKLTNMIYETQAVVNGTVKMKLYKGSAVPVARQSTHNSLYDEDLATYTSADSFDQEAAAGFIKLWTLPTTVFEQVNHVHSEEKQHD